MLMIGKVVTPSLVCSFHHETLAACTLKNQSVQCKVCETIACTFKLFVVFLLVILRFPLQLESIPNSRSLDFIRRTETVRDCVDRGLYGSVNEHGGRGIERGGGWLRSGDG
mmetsp:Transcript_16189/g.30547  ORF Transcript_16189/g.30547 Transcript_16189/m.30547 type:complete len:111 (+) Transcript_16189:225-557(+)